MTGDGDDNAKRRELLLGRQLDLGHYGKIPISSLYQTYVDTEDGGELIFHQTKQTTLGGWVYDAAAVLAKYLETPHFASKDKKGGSLKGQKLIELGAGTGVVGMLAGYYGAEAILTDLEQLVPLLDYNIEKNQSALKGKVTAAPLCWGESVAHCLPHPDYLILANCVYYRCLEVLVQTVNELTGPNTTILACYEERTEGIHELVESFHQLLKDNFLIEEVPKEYYHDQFNQDFVRIVRMTPTNN